MREVFTGSVLADQFRETVSKLKDPRMSREAEFDVAYPTGFLGFDFANGVKVWVKTDKIDVKYNSIGVVDGTMISVVGRSGCGKTTATLQMAGNIIRPFKTSCIFHEEIEAGSSSMRKRQLLKMTEEQFNNRYIARNTGITTENFYERMKMIADEKIANRKTYEYDTGLYDPTGNKIFKLEPTVVILDSFAMLMPAELGDGDELAGGMAATSIAKLNTQLIKRIIPILKSANIIFFVINHILPDPSPIPKKAQVAWLKMGERCPGGETAIYLANNFIRVNDGTKLKPDKDFGISGIKVDLEIIKSRSNTAGVSVPMVLNYDIGFDETLSLFQLLKDHGKVSGGAYMYIDGHDDVKFTQKLLKQKLQESPELQQYFMQAAFDVLETLISTNAVKEMEKDLKLKEEGTEVFDLTAMMLNNPNFTCGAA